MLAIVLGGLCAAFAAVSYQSAKAAAAMPFAAGGFDERCFWHPVFVACMLWTVAGFHFFASRKRVPPLVLVANLAAIAVWQEIECRDYLFTLEIMPAS